MAQFHGTHLGRHFGRNRVARSHKRCNHRANDVNAKHRGKERVRRVPRSRGPPINVCAALVSSARVDYANCAHALQHLRARVSRRMLKPASRVRTPRTTCITSQNANFARARNKVANLRYFAAESVIVLVAADNCKLRQTGAHVTSYTYSRIFEKN